MKKVLLLTYYWPPGSGPGVQRWLKFCKYLPEFGVEPVVITVKNGSYPNQDPSLEKDIPSGLRVLKTRTFEPFSIYNFLRGKKGKSVEVGLGSLKNKPGLFAQLSNYVRANYFIPDARIGWNNYSHPAARKVIQTTRPDVVITTGPPHSTHLVGMKLQNEFGLKWAADFRDPWTTIYYNAMLNRTANSQNKDVSLEQQVLAKCDLLIVPTPGMALEFEGRCKKIVVIPNGFDESDFTGTDILPSSEKLIISYIGNFKANQNMPALWQALKVLKEEMPSLPFELQLTGNVHNDIMKSIQDAGIEDRVAIRPFVDHAEAISLMKRSSVLLLPVPQSEGNKLILTGKIFEYLATRRPILSVGPTDGNASEVLTNCGHSPMLDYSDLAGTVERLKTYAQDFQSHQLSSPVGNNKYEQYSRRELTQNLAKELNQLTIS